MKRFLSIILTIAMLVSVLPLSVFATNESIDLMTFDYKNYKPNGHYFYHQKQNHYKWYSNVDVSVPWGNTSSLCYVTSIAMLLSDMGVSNADPYAVYQANGNSAYISSWANLLKKFNATQKRYELSNLSNADKKATIISALNSNPNGVLVQVPNHMIVARKVVNNEVYFDDPVYGCCLSIDKVWNGGWGGVNAYRTLSVSGNSTSNKTPSISQGTTSNTNTATSTKLDKSVYINLTNYPTNGFVPKSFPLKGTIKSDYPIYYITGIIKNSDTGEEICHWDNPGLINSKKYNIQGSSLDKAMKFNNIRYSGNYRLRIIATNSLGKSATVDKDFTVIGQNQYTSQQPSISISNTEEGQRAVISCGDGNAIIHYTVNGGREKTGYGSLSQEFTSAGYYNISAWTTRSGYNDSAVTNKTVSVSKLSTPKISDVKYGINNAFVTISGNGSINYTTNGNTPTKRSASYTGPVYLDKTSTVKAIASRYGEENSSIAQKRIFISAPDTPSEYKIQNRTGKNCNRKMGGNRQSNKLYCITVL